MFENITYANINSTIQNIHLNSIINRVSTGSNTYQPYSVFIDTDNKISNTGNNSLKNF